MDRITTLKVRKNPNINTFKYYEQSVKNKKQRPRGITREQFRRTITYGQSQFDSDDLYEIIKGNILENKDKRDYLYDVYNICINHNDIKKDIYFEYKYSKWFKNKKDPFQESNHLSFHKRGTRNNTIHLSYWIFLENSIPQKRTIKYKLLDNDILPIQIPYTRKYTEINPTIQFITEPGSTTIERTQIPIQYKLVWKPLLEFISNEIGEDNQINNNLKSNPKRDTDYQCIYNNINNNEIYPSYYYVENNKGPPSFTQYIKDKRNKNKFYKKYVERRKIDL